MEGEAHQMGAAMNNKAPVAVGHRLPADDPENPFNWPLLKRIYVTAVAFSFTFVVAFGITSHTAGISGVVTRFGVSMTEAQLSFSIIFFGIFFAPIYTPHLSERLGRAPVYLMSLPLFALFILGVGFSQNFSSVLALRFFAGFFGGPCLVLIEGTFADVWSARTTVTYYSVLTLASYLGAAFGPVVCGFVFAATNWQWPSWVTLMLALAAFLFGLGMPETYGREIMRTRARRSGQTLMLPAAPSGETLSEMARITLFTPLKMLFTQPIVMLISIYLAVNFAVIFQWFITVPAVLGMVYGFSVQKAGLGFIAAVGGSLLAAAVCIALDTVSFKRPSNGMPTIENRLVPAMVGSFCITASLFWIGWTASPDYSYYSPIFGTVLYVFGNMSVLVSFISYLFDAFPPVGTLAALTTAACLRIACAGILPIFILQMFTNITGAWALSTFGFISAVMIPIPFLLFFFGARLRARSKYSEAGTPTVQMEMASKMSDEHRTMSEA